MSIHPIALPSVLPSELLVYILSHQSYPTTLIICQSRTTFLTSLLNCVPRALQQLTPRDEDAAAASEPLPPHPLLIPTLNQVATSRYISLVFIPTVSHLRAYLATFPPVSKGRSQPNKIFQNQGETKPLLVIYGLVGLHRDTSEWSAQGLGNSVAGLVEAGWRSGRKIALMEEKKLGGVGDAMDERHWRDGKAGYDALGEESHLEEAEVESEHDEEAGKAVLKVWEEKIPILNGSMRRAGLEIEDGGWSGRTVEVGRILGRWFKFGRGNWDELV